MDGLSSSWLDSLHSHPIFRSPASPYARDDDDDGHLLPPSPDASSIHGFNSFTNAHGRSETGSTIGTIIGGPPRETGNGSKGLEEVGQGRKRSNGCIARRSELLVAVGREVRIASLAGYKAKVDGGSSSTTGGAYKVGERMISMSREARSPKSSVTAM